MNALTTTFVFLGISLPVAVAVLLIPRRWNRFLPGAAVSCMLLAAVCVIATGGDSLSADATSVETSSNPIPPRPVTADRPHRDDPDEVMFSI